MKFVCYRQWQQLPECVNALFDQYAQESIFYTRLWFENIAQNALKDDYNMMIACVLDGDHALAVLPLMQYEQSWRSLSAYYTALYTVLLASNEQDKVLDCLVDGLKQLPLEQLYIEPFDEHDQAIQHLQNALESAGFQCCRSFRFYNWHHRLQGQSFADYMVSRPGQVRSTIKRKARKLMREQGYEIQLFTHDSLQQAIRDYQLIYRASWKASETFADFTNGLILSTAKPDWLRLGILYIAGRPAAGQIWLVVKGKANIYRLAYDEQWKPYSPGSILTQYMMEYVIDTDKVEEIDFLIGQERYKLDWMSEKRKRYGLHCAIKPAQKGFVGTMKKLLGKI